MSLLSPFLYSNHPRANSLMSVKMRKDVGSEIWKCYLIPRQFGYPVKVAATTLLSLVWSNSKFSLVALQRAAPQQLTPTSTRSGRPKLLQGSVSSAQLKADCCSPSDRLHLVFSGPTQMLRVTNRCLDFAQPTHWCHKERLIPLRWGSLFVCIPTTTVGQATMGKKLIKEKPNFVLGATDIKCDV